MIENCFHFEKCGQAGHVDVATQADNNNNNRNKRNISINSNDDDDDDDDNYNVSGNVVRRGMSMSRRRPIIGTAVMMMGARGRGL